MYNILFFGLKEDRLNVCEHFSSLPCKFLSVDSATEFYSTAFSRIFDVWIIESTHPDFSEIALSELTSSYNTPHIFLCGDAESKSRVKAFTQISKVNLIAKGDIGRHVDLFSQLMRDNREQNREKYLAGYIHSQPGREAIVT